MGSRYGPVVSPAPTILRPRVRIPSASFTLYSIYVVEIEFVTGSRKGRKINIKESGYLKYFR